MADAEQSEHSSFSDIDRKMAEEWRKNYVAEGIKNELAKYAFTNSKNTFYLGKMACANKTG